MEVDLVKKWYSPCLDILTIVPAMGALDCCLSSKGTRQHQGSLMQQSNRLWERVVPVGDGQGSFIWPISPILHQLRDCKICWAGQEILNETTKNKQQLTAWFKFAMVMHCVAGMHPSGNGRACEILHPQILQSKWRYRGGGCGHEWGSTSPHGAIRTKNNRHNNQLM